MAMEQPSRRGFFGRFVAAFSAGTVAGSTQAKPPERTHEIYQFDQSNIEPSVIDCEGSYGSIPVEPTQGDSSCMVYTYDQFGECVSIESIAMKTVIAT